MIEAPMMLIPAAGFGRRVGSPAAKELLPGRSGQPMILTPLQLAHSRGWPAHVVVRREKAELLDFLEAQKARFSQLSIQIIDPTADWPDSLLASFSHWRDKNIVYLPDTELSPVTVLDEIAEALNGGSDVAWASHPVSHQSTWGILAATESGRIRLCEKPPTPEAGRAWGVYGFCRSAGLSLLQAQSRSTHDHQWRELSLQGREFELDLFEDLTRRL